MGNTIEHRLDSVDYKDADDRGRITLGSEFAGEKVFVAWATIDMNPEDVATPPEDVREKLSELWRWANENGYKMIDSDPYEGKILTSDADWIDTDVEGVSENVA